MGLDKLLKSLAAEKDRKFPVLRFDDHELYGDTYGQYAGGLFTILTRDPRNISSVLSKQSSKFGDASLRRMCFGPLLGDGIFTEDGRAWETSRRLLAPVLNKPHFPVLHTIETHVQDLFLAISRAHSGRDGPRVVDLRPLFFNFTLDTATELLLGVSTATLRHDFVSDSDNEGARFSAAFNTALLWLARREHFKSFGWLVQGPEFTRVCTTARSSLERLITDALATQESHGANNSSHSALHDIVTQTPNLAKARDEFLSLLFAARDTTASSLCWVFYALSREPRVFEKLQSEIFSALGDDAGSERRDVRAPEEAHLRRMHYLDAVFYETLRLFPPVPMNARMCSEDTTLPSGGGVEGEDQIFVPKGTLVAFSTYGTQRSRKYWGEGAGTFKPERWLGDDGTTTNKAKESTRDWSFHPFIGGPRKCLGGKSSNAFLF